MRVVAHIAQAVEHFLGKEEVTGSSPVVGTIGLLLLTIKWENVSYGEGKI